MFCELLPQEVLGLLLKRLLPQAVLSHILTWNRMYHILTAARDFFIICASIITQVEICFKRIDCYVKHILTHGVLTQVLSIRSRCTCPRISQWWGRDQLIASNSNLDCVVE
jgi:hypothetical protein